MDYVGFAKLRKHRIHLFCPACGRKMSNMHRDTNDPPNAVLVHIYCLRCSEGCKESPVSFFSARGKRIREAWEGPA